MNAIILAEFTESNSLSISGEFLSGFEVATIRDRAESSLQKCRMVSGKGPLRGLSDCHGNTQLERDLASDGVHGPFGFQEMGGIDFVTFPFLPYRL